VAENVRYECFAAVFDKNRHNIDIGNAEYSGQVFAKRANDGGDPLRCVFSGIPNIQESENSFLLQAWSSFRPLATVSIKTCHYRDKRFRNTPAYIDLVFDERSNLWG
jgi:hypothetical protein